MIELIDQGIWAELSTEEFPSFAPFLTEPMILLKNLQEIRAASVNEAVLEESILGIKSSHATGQSIELPLLDYDLCLFIALNEVPGDDIAMVLDYRCSRTEPRVLASDFSGAHPHCEWRVVAESFSELHRKLTAGWPR